MIEKNPELKESGDPEYLHRKDKKVNTIRSSDIQMVSHYYAAISEFVIGDCQDRDLPLVRCATEDGFGFQSSGEYYYVNDSPVNSDSTKTKRNLSKWEIEILHIARQKSKLFIKDLLPHIKLPVIEIHHMLLNLVGKKMISRKFEPFRFSDKSALLDWVVDTNGGYEFFWSYHRTNELLPSRVTIDFDPIEPLEYNEIQEVANRLKCFLNEMGFHPRVRLPGGKIGGVNFIISTDFSAIPNGYLPFEPLNNSIEMAIQSKGKYASKFRCYIDFVRKIIQLFAKETQLNVPLYFEEKSGSILIDLRRNLEIGARSLGTIHHRKRYSDGPHVCIPCLGDLPGIDELRKTTSLEYVRQNPSILNEPEEKIIPNNDLEYFFKI